MVPSSCASTPITALWLPAIGKLVCDPERYRALTGSAATEGFFPAWRRPDSAETPAGAEQLANDSR